MIQDAFSPQDKKEIICFNQHLMRRETMLGDQLGGQKDVFSTCIHNQPCSRKVDSLQHFSRRTSNVLRGRSGGFTQIWHSGHFSSQSSENERPRLPRYGSVTEPSTARHPYGTVAAGQRSINQSCHQLVSKIKPDDVLSGRGGATNSHSGNRAFRTLVKRYQDQYLQAKKREKPAVASTIVSKVRNRGGRFLRRIDTTPSGELLWIDIGDERAKEKTCQALREGAPEIRKKRSTGLGQDEDETSRSCDVAFSFSSSIGWTDSSIAEQSTFTFGKSDTNFDRSCTVPKKSISTLCGDDCFIHDGPIMIRPSSMLTWFSFSKAVSVDQLEPHDRELYLKDFLPPNPTFRPNNGTGHEVQPPMCFHYCTNQARTGSPWSVVQV